MTTAALVTVHSPTNGTRAISVRGERSDFWAQRVGKSPRWNVYRGSTFLATVGGRQIEFTVAAAVKAEG